MMSRVSVSPPAIPPGGTPGDKRHFGASTDDAAIFLEDTMDLPTAQCISLSPSAAAILSPQRAPTNADHVDVTEYDAVHLGSARKSGGAHRDGSGLSGAAVRLNFGKSPTPKMNRLHNSSSLSRSAQRPDSQSASRHHQSHSAARPSGVAFTPASKLSTGMDTPSHSTLDEACVALSEYERLERERNRYQKMYEHQKVLYEEMSEKNADTYQKLQDRIVEVVALSTRNEESKRFIRQLKKEMSESRTRVMNMQNRVLEDQRADRLDRGRYEAMLKEQDAKYDRMLARHEAKMAGLESLVKDLTCIEDEHGAIHVAQLDALLRASYSKSTALFSDLLRQGRQIDYFYDSKADLDLQVDQLRKEKREMEASIAEERRHTMYQTERFVEQIEEQQQQILSLRQMLIRTMECVEADEDGEMGSFGSRSSSFHSMSDEEEYVVEVDHDFATSARTARGSGGSSSSSKSHKDAAAEAAGSTPLMSHAVVRVAQSRKPDAKPATARGSDAPPATAAPAAGGRTDCASPAFLAERERNRPLLSTVVRQSAPHDDKDGNEDDANDGAERDVETEADARETSRAKGSTAAASSTNNAHATRRSHGRLSSGSAAKGAASLIATAGTRRSGGDSAPKKEVSPSSSSSAPPSHNPVRADDNAPSATASMVRRKSDGLFAAPAEKTKREDSDGRPGATAATSQGRASAKKLDFSTALAAVAEIRERSRQARASAERGGDETEADKENTRVHITTATGSSVRAAKEAPSKVKSVTRVCDDDDDDDNDAAPRLTPHSRSHANTQGGSATTGAKSNFTSPNKKPPTSTAMKQKCSSEPVE